MDFSDLHPLADAVAEQLGYGSDELLDRLVEVANHGGNTGWPGFTCTRETCDFTARNRRAIAETVAGFADECGTTAIELVRGFNGIEDDTPEETIGRALWGQPEDDDDEADTVDNHLAWLALEEVAQNVLGAMDSGLSIEVK